MYLAEFHDRHSLQLHCLKTLWRKKSALRFPVSRVKARNPLGHSGQRRLQAVVGSKLMLKGRPPMRGSLLRFACWKLAHKPAALRRRRGVAFRDHSRASRPRANIGRPSYPSSEGGRALLLSTAPLRPSANDDLVRSPVLAVVPGLPRPYGGGARSAGQRPGGLRGGRRR